MTFPEACSAIYQRELQADFEREIKEDFYLPQQAFKSCMARAKGLQHSAQVAVDNFTALCILLHREGHDEDRDTEKAILISSMPEEDVELAGTYSWWAP